MPLPHAFTDPVLAFWHWKTHDSNEDGFGNPRFTKFCHVYATKQFINGSTFNLPGERARPHDTGNDAD